MKNIAYFPIMREALSKAQREKKKELECNNNIHCKGGNDDKEKQPDDR